MEPTDGTGDVAKRLDEMDSALRDAIAEMPGWSYPVQSGHSAFRPADFDEMGIEYSSTWERYIAIHEKFGKCMIVLDVREPVCRKDGIRITFEDKLKMAEMGEFGWT